MIYQVSFYRIWLTSTVFIGALLCQTISAEKERRSYIQAGKVIVPSFQDLKLNVWNCLIAFCLSHLALIQTFYYSEVLLGDKARPVQYQNQHLPHHLFEPFYLLDIKNESTNFYVSKQVLSIQSRHLQHLSKSKHLSLYQETFGNDCSVNKTEPYPSFRRSL